jgi:hypothetical protein
VFHEYLEQGQSTRSQRSYPAIWAAWRQRIRSWSRRSPGHCSDRNGPTLTHDTIEFRRLPRRGGGAVSVIVHRAESVRIGVTTARLSQNGRATRLGLFLAPLYDWCVHFSTSAHSSIVQDAIAECLWLAWARIAFDS